MLISSFSKTWKKKAAGKIQLNVGTIRPVSHME
jgi:hypothetical protein